MSVEVWITFTRAGHQGPVSKPESCFGIATLADFDQRPQKIRKVDSDKEMIVDMARENIQLVGYRPPIVVPHVKWKMRIRYKPDCNYGTSLHDHIKAATHPNIKLVVTDDICIEYALSSKQNDPRSFFNRCIVHNSNAVSSEFQIQKIKKLENIKNEILSSRLELWIRHSYFLFDEAHTNITLPDIIIMTTLWDSDFFYDFIQMDIVNRRYRKQFLSGIRKDIKTIFQNTQKGRLRLCDMDNNNLPIVSKAFSQIWHRVDLVWEDLFVAIKIFYAFHAVISSQTNSCRGYFIGVDLDSICEFAKINRNSITTPQMDMVSRILVVKNGNKLFTSEMFQTVHLINDMFESCSLVSCIVHRGIFTCDENLEKYCFRCENVKRGSVVNRLKKSRIDISGSLRRKISFCNIHSLYPEDFVALAKWIRNHCRTVAIMFTFDPSGCQCGSYYNWCIGIFAKVQILFPEEISYWEDPGIMKINHIEIIPCSRSKALCRRWLAEESMRKENDVHWVSAGLAINKLDKKETDVISKNNWVADKSCSGGFYGIVDSTVGTDWVKLIKFNRSGQIEILERTSIHSFVKIHSIPSDIMVSTENIIDMNVIGIYAPEGIGLFSGWEIAVLLRCMAMAKKRIYVYTPFFEEFMHVIRKEIGEVDFEKESVFSKRKEIFMASELLTIESLSAFSSLDPCLDILLSKT
jgi:hypothetical protein